MNELVDALKQRFGSALQRVDEIREETSVVVERGAAPQVLQWLKEWGFDLLEDLTAVDWLKLDHGPTNPNNERFSLVYLLASLAKGLSLRVRVPVTEEDPRLPTVVPLWPTANWMEREVFDMFGIRFDGHPEMERILMPADYEHFPLRKEFPVNKRPE